MRCILGIGNPGSRYENTRHNVGFYLVDNFAAISKIKFKPSKSDFYFAEGEIEQKQFLLVKPTTYVNRTGDAVQQCLSSLNFSIDNLLVIVDDANLDFAEIRLRKSGGDGGHNGLSSIIYSTGSDNFSRLRFGIGKDYQKGELSNFVLSRFTSDELHEIDKLSEITFTLIKSFIIDGYDFMLSEYSRIKNMQINQNRASDIK